MTSKLAALLMAGGLSWGALATTQQVVTGAQGAAASTAAGPPTFTVRANPRWAAQINDVLGEVGEWIETTIPVGASVDAYLNRWCGGLKPVRIESQRRETATTLRFSPCVRVKRNAEIPVTAGDTLEGLAARNGLSRAESTTLKVKPAGQPTQSRAIDPAALRAGDIVVVPAMPRWTQVTTRSEKTPDRAAFVAAIAKKLTCAAGATPEDCLLQHGVTVLDHGPASTPKESESDAPGSSRGARGDQLRFLTAPQARASLTEETVSDIPVTTGVRLTIPVAEKQWPFDESLLAAMLTDPSIRVTPAVIGVADGGLGSKTGAPLPADLFDRGPDVPDDNNIDDDGNDYVDDAIGGGLPRPGEVLGSGHVGLCGGPLVDFSSWTPDALNRFSHGTIVTSIASGMKLRQTPEVSKRLPRIVFFRMLSNVCGPDAGYTVGDGQMVTAFDYLTTRATIINISYTIDSSKMRAFTDAMKNTLPYFNRLLVLPAGNDTPGDLDSSRVCPMCLGNPSVDSNVARRTLVVGAATRELKRAEFSNFGENTVRLFAPGEPVGAVNVKGDPVPGSEAATSYAAPLAALAAGLMQSLGITDPDSLLDRLAVATWPLDDSASRPERTNVGVLDLVKAAAVQHDAIEVIEADANGDPVRRTYVGRLLDPLEKVAICAGQPFHTNAVQGIRLGPAAANGERAVRVYWKNKRENNRRIVQTLAQPCRPSGNLRINTLQAGGARELRTFPLASIAEIQIHWIP